MKNSVHVGNIWLALILLAMTPFFTARETGAAPPPAVPEAFIGAPDFEFSPVVEGTVVTHDFIIENRGKAPLLIQSVKTGCGCTTADYEKSIEPGAQGHIKINGNTSGYGGNVFSRTIMVSTNDPEREKINLNLSGKVEVFAVIEPKVVLLRGIAGENIHTQVTIMPNNHYPFHVIESSADPGLEGKVTFSLEPRDGMYLLTVNNVRDEPDQYKGYIQLKTDNAGQPPISILVTGLIQAGKSR